MVHTFNDIDKCKTKCHLHSGTSRNMHIIMKMLLVGLTLNAKKLRLPKQECYSNKHMHVHHAPFSMFSDRNIEDLLNSFKTLQNMSKNQLAIMITKR